MYNAFRFVCIALLAEDQIVPMLQGSVSIETSKFFYVEQIVVTMILCWAFQSTLRQPLCAHFRVAHTKCVDPCDIELVGQCLAVHCALFYDYRQPTTHILPWRLRS